MLGNLNGWHFLILLVVVLLVFGASKLPALAKSLAQSLKIFRGEMKGDASSEAPDSSRNGVNKTDKNTD